MRVLGPNCEGLASLPAAAPLTFSPVLDIDASGTRLSPGNIAVLSQSGGMGFAVAQWGTAVGLDFSFVITTGNEYDLDCLELAGHLVDTPETDVVVMLIEGVRDPAGLRAVGERFRQAGKRLVVAKLGKTAPGARGAYAHTRHDTGDAEEYRRLFRACGVAEAADPEELIDVVQAIAKSRRLGTGNGCPPGARVGIATTSGGAGVWLADACAERGLAVPVLSPAPAGDAEGAHAAVRLAGQPGRPDRAADRGRVGRAAARRAGRLWRGRRHPAGHLAVLGPAGARQGGARRADRLVRVAAFVFSYTRPAPSCVRILEELGVPWYTSATRAARGLTALVKEA